MDRINAKRAQIRVALADPGRRCGMMVHEAMTVAPNCIPEETTALELVELFHARGFRHLLVTSPERGLVGVISDRDVIRCFGPEQSPSRSTLEGIRASDLMSTDLITVGPNVPLERAVELMVDQGISCLPVLVDGTLRGILTATDLQVVLQLLLQTSRHSSLEESIR
jgi:acetoin utilization protein AcuB